MNCEECPFVRSEKCKRFCPYHEKPQKPIKPFPVSLSKMAAWYYPRLKDLKYRNKLLKKRLVKAGIYKYLSVAKRRRKLHGLNALSLRDFIIITTKLGDPPPQMPKLVYENSEEVESPF